MFPYNGSFILLPYTLNQPWPEKWTQDKAGFRNLRAAEIKHGRVAMMAAAAWQQFRV